MQFVVFATWQKAARSPLSRDSRFSRSRSVPVKKTSTAIKRSNPETQTKQMAVACSAVEALFMPSFCTCNLHGERVLLSHVAGHQIRDSHVGHGLKFRDVVNVVRCVGPSYDARGACLAARSTGQLLHRTLPRWHSG
eukprot:3035168-Rhodomonas_salina.1